MCATKMSFFYTKLGPNFLEELMKIDRANQDHCQYCAVNRRIVEQLTLVDE